MKPSVSFAFLLTFVLEATETSFAFVPTKNISGRNVAAFLHPDQAGELEAQAYDLMKQAIEEEAEAVFAVPASEATNGLAQDISTKLRNEPTPTGPVSWCRKNLWPFKETTNTEEKLP